VTNLFRVAASPIGAPAQTRRIRTLLAVAVALALSLLFAPSAGAVVTTIGGQTFGSQPHATDLDTFSFSPISVLQYGGGPVVHASSTYAIYWDPSILRPGDPGRPGKYHGDWQRLTNQFLHDMGENSGSLGNVFSLTSQYTETGGARAAYSSVFRGGYADHDSYPADGCTDPEPALNRNFACLTDQQLRDELRTFIAANELHAGLGTIFYLMTPPGVTICMDAGGINGHCSDSALSNPWSAESLTPSPEEEAEHQSYANSFCSYHSTTSTLSSETALYAVIPWVAGTYGSNLKPANRSGSDCQDGSVIMQEPNQDGLNSFDGFYDHALPDVLINQIAAQQIATITNPLFNAWDEPISGNEVPDQCRNWFEAPPVVQGSGTPDEHTGAAFYTNQTIGGHSYYLNTEFDQAAHYYDYPGLPCVLSNNFLPRFTAPNPVNAGDIVSFDGNESVVTLEQSANAGPSSQPLYRANFAWDFGDGTTVSGPGYSAENPPNPLYASVFHAYRYGGQYQVTLTITDAGGDIASANQTITVVGPPPPSEGPGGSGSGGAAGSGTGAQSPANSTSSPGGGPTTSAPAPVARASATSSSLGQALRRGLAVTYTVNEQVAGQFEVLLDKHTAQRLKIGGPTAVGLPKGSAPALVIGRALVVTTKGGHSALHIKFSKSAIAHLRRVHRLSLMLRLVVRNAASQNPQSATVVSTVVLHR
jgi:hypothetical protein